MSVTGTIPPTRTDEAFNAIFESKSNARKSQDVMSTLSNTVDSLEGSAEEAGLRWELLAESEGKGDTIHLDGAPQKVGSFEDLMGRLPFEPPPAPGPAENAEMASMEPLEESHQAADAEAESKAWKVTVTVTESTGADGQKNITASLSPLMRIPNPPPNAEDRSPGRQYIIEQPMLDQMVEQQIRDGNRKSEGDNGMFAISVKRQRKLKMKKHKYKKLMKRTRTLRRKLGRI
jgi:hypothetical protein